MSATLKTQNYNLPVFAEEDFTDWSSYNESMEIIDASMQENKEKIETVEEAEQTGAAAIQQIQQSVVVINDTIQHQSQDLDSLTTRLENNESHDNDRDLAITAIQNEVSSYDGRISAINDSVNYLKQDITDIENNQSQMQTNINNMTNQISENTESIEEIKSNNGYYIKRYFKDNTYDDFSFDTENGALSVDNTRQPELNGFTQELNLLSERKYSMYKGRAKIPVELSLKVDRCICSTKILNFMSKSNLLIGTAQFSTVEGEKSSDMTQIYIGTNNLVNFSINTNSTPAVVGEKGYITIDYEYYAFS